MVIKLFQKIIKGDQDNKVQPARQEQVKELLPVLGVTAGESGR